MARLSDDGIKTIKDKLSKATPGKWEWRMNPKAKDLMIISNASMSPIVMTFWRWGMYSAIAVFNDFKHDILEKADKWGIRREPHHDYNFDINHPDARLIADASTDMRNMLDTIEALQAENEQFRALAAKIPRICKRYDGWSCQAYQSDEAGCPHTCPNWEVPHD